MGVPPEESDSERGAEGKGGSASAAGIASDHAVAAEGGGASGDVASTIGGHVAAKQPPAEAPKAAGPKKYTFFVGPGNNSELVRATIERRAWWELGKEDDPELNLKWLQVRNRSAAEYARRMGNRQFLNHLDNLTCIGRKNELYKNLKEYCDREKINIHEIAPPTFVVQVGDMCNEYVEFTRVCKQLEAKNIARGAVAAKAVKNAVSAISAMSKGASSSGGGDAADETESLASAASTAEQGSEAGDAKGKQAAGGPKSPTKAGGPGGAVGGKKARSRGEAIAGTSTAGDRNIWIIKPTNNNRGNGIRVFNTFAQIDEHLKKKNNGCQVIVQKYIEKPLLYKNRKFDIRVLCMVDDKMQVYVYRKAYCRTSTQEYSLDNINDLFIHLTNYAVQKKNKGKPNKNLEEDEIDEDEEPQEEGNNLSMEDLSDYLKEHFPDGLDGDGIMDRIREIIVLIFQSVWKKLNPSRERNTFEVYGLDFLIDDEMNIWLIEVNTNPYIGCSSQILREIFTGMLEGCAKICLDPNFPPPPGTDWPEVEEVEYSDLWDKVYPN